MENLEIKKVTIDKVIPSVKLIWDTMKEFNQINSLMMNNDLARKYFIEAVVEDYLDDELLLLGAFIDGEVIGVIGSKENYINFFFVKKEYQNQKIGKQLMHAMLKNQKRKYSDRVEVDASSYAYDIYKHFGFAEVEGLTIENNEHPMVYELRRDKYGI